MKEQVAEIVNTKVFEAQAKVDRCYRDLDKAEDELSEVLKQYGLKSPKEKDISDCLPTALLWNGFKLFVVEEIGYNPETKRIKDVFLSDKDNNELKHWYASPSLTELIELSYELTRVK